MSDSDTNTTTQNTTPHTNGTTVLPPQTEGLVPAFRLEQELHAKREATEAQQSQASEIAALRAQLEKVQSEYQAATNRHTRDLHMIDLGFADETVRDFFSREYDAKMARTAEKDQVSYADWVQAMRTSPLYAPHYPAQPEAAAEGQPGTQANNPIDPGMLEAMTRLLGGNPNAGTSQPADSRAKEWTQEEIVKERARNGGKLSPEAKQAILAQFRSKNLIK